MIRRGDKSESPLRVVALCRGEGLGYVLVSDAVDRSLEVTAACGDGVAVPCSCFAVRDGLLRNAAPGAARVWVVVLPLLSADCSLRFSSDGNELLSTVFSAVRSKVSSRLLTLRKPQIAQALRGYERRCGAGRVSVRIREAWPGESGFVVWRIRVRMPYEGDGTTASLRICDAGANECPCEVTVMEDQVVPNERSKGQLVRLLTFSCKLSQEVRAFYAVCCAEDSNEALGFDGMNAPRAAAMLADAHRLAGGASANGDYESWFQRNRATEAELAQQRAAVREMDENELPLISLVMPVYRTPRAFLRAALESVVAQSYPKWELVVVNASDACAEVDEVLAAFADERIRVVQVENRTISENTNAGIGEARGSYVGFLDHDDVLEPDALWCMWQEIGAHPSADVLYSDEDHMDDTHVHGPAFKTFPNYGKLYEHNYVTHLLVVSRYVLDHTERSGADVAGAQDYDLTLKAFEVAREIVHVPRVLYHWREHEGSTSGGGDQKPYAHAAGQRALAAHLARRGIAAQVDDGAIPYTYRVRYELPDPAPKVSVVIPARDHADLLQACVTSVLERSTYRNLEIVLVENNSTQGETFACYERLTARDDRVRVVEWQPPEPGAFNYSAIVNYGVAQSTGEYLVLLNNDTEVIEEGWIEEMMGCLMRPEVGVVGAKLLFADGLIQHVGMVGNPEGYFCHVCQNLTRDALGPGYAAAMPGDYSMVTGACQMMRRSLFEELGGYDEELAVGFNDGDFCLRAREAGYSVTVCAHALLHHREFSSRGRESTDTRLKARFLRERALTMQRHSEFFAAGDPALNPNLDPFGAYFDIPRDRG